MSEMATLIGTDFRASAGGKMEAAKIEEIVAKLQETADQFPADCDVVSMIFYLQFKCWLTGPEPGNQPTFRGSGGGVSSPGGGVCFGDVYTDDLGTLTSETSRFEFNLTPVYSSLLFFDDSSNLLGHFESASISTVLGVGGGSGTWDTEIE